MIRSRTSFKGARGVAAANWWEAGGATGAVAVYQPKGAASLAASYTDLSGNGNDAAPGVAPTFDASDGWMFDASLSQRLLTGVVDTTTTSFLVRFSDGDRTNNEISLVGSTWCRFDLRNTAFDAGGTRSRWMHSSGGINGGSNITAGVSALTPESAYFDGAVIGAIPSVSALGRMLVIAARGENAGGTSTQAYFTGKIQAVAIYNTTLTADMVAAVTTAMQAL